MTKSEKRTVLLSCKAMLDILKPRLVQLQKRGEALELKMKKCPKFMRDNNNYPEAIQIEHNSIAYESKMVIESIGQVRNIYNTVNASSTE